MNKNIEDILKIRFLEKYNYILSKMDLISALFYGTKEKDILLDGIESILFSNDDLENNEGVDFLNYLDYFKPLIIKQGLKEYKNNKILYYTNIKKDIPKNNILSINYYEEKILEYRNMTENDFKEKMNFEKLIRIMYLYIINTTKYDKNYQKKIDVLSLYLKFYQKFNIEQGVFIVDDYKLLNKHHKHLRNNEYINYFSSNKEQFYEEFKRTKIK